MKIEKDKYVVIDYTLKDGKDNLLDTTEGNQPLAFVFGKSSIIPALEVALEGKENGYSGNVIIEPKDAYGERDDSLMQTIDMDQFEDPKEISAGMQFTAEDEHGKLLLTVIKVDKDGVLVDGNHPLAGVTMNFELQVREVRDATEEELNPKSCCGSGDHGSDGCGSGGCGCNH